METKSELSVWWASLTKSDRNVLIVGVSAVVVALVAGAIWIAMPSKQVLFSDLSDNEINKIANRLSQQGVDVSVDSKEGQVLVATSDLHKARLIVAESDLSLPSSVGFELFDDADFGMTDFTQRINYQRALEGELTRTIKSLREVEQARLHLVLPENSLFSEKTRQPKASLTLKVRAGEQLSASRVKGIQRLIASAVPALSPETVAVHDEQGVSLVGDSDSPASEAVSSRLRAKLDVESHLSRKAQEVLDQIFDPGAARVSIDVEIDFDRRQISREEVLPVRDTSTGAVRSLKSTRSRLMPGSNAAADEDAENAEAVAVIPPQPETTEVEYETGRHSERINVAQGAVVRMTIGILAPGNLTEPEQAQVEEIVGNVVGFNAGRGDRIAVVSSALFAKKPASEKDGALEAPAEDIGMGDLAAFRQMMERGGAGLWPLVGVGSLLLLMLGAVLIALLRSQAGRLSDAERQSVLLAVERWLEADSAGRVRQ